MDNPNNRVFKPTNFVNFKNGRFTFFEMDEQWRNDPLYKRMLTFIEMRTMTTFNVVTFLISSLGLVYLSPTTFYMAPWLLIWIRSYYKICNYTIGTNNYPYSSVIRRMELHENGHIVTIVLSNFLKE